jgi:FkbM family methyltransferase
MKKPALPLQVLADTLLYLPHLLESPLPRSRKLGLLAEYARLSFLLFAGLARSRRARILSFDVGYFDLPTLHLLYRVVFIRNEYYFKAANARPLILDCGANIGMATLYFKWLYPRCEIHAFEPEPRTFQALQQNVLQNELEHVSCYPAAISGQDGEADFHFDREFPGDIRMSLLPRHYADSVRVRTMALSRFIRDVLSDREIDYLKLDLEGAEMEALDDLADSGSLRRAREIFIEFHHRIDAAPSQLGRCLSLLTASGFDYSVETFHRRRQAEDRFQCINLFATRKGAP